MRAQESGFTLIEMLVALAAQSVIIGAVLVMLDSSQMEGIEAAFAARCELCNQETWALKAGANTTTAESTANDSVTSGVGKRGVADKPDNP